MVGVAAQPFAKCFSKVKLRLKRSPIALVKLRGLLASEVFGKICARDSDLYACFDGRGCVEAPIEILPQRLRCSEGNARCRLLIDIA